MNRLLLVLLLSPLFGWAQTTIDTLHWRAARRLELADFHAPTHVGLGGSEFHYQIGYEVHPTSIWSQPAIESFCLMFRNLSWISETARNARTLAYNQLLFDLVEVHSRQMKAKLIALPIDKNFKQQAKQIEYLTNSELGDEVNRFRSETGGGDDLIALERWQQRVAKQLYDIPELVTTYQPSRIGYGINLSGSLSLPIGPAAQILNPSTGIGIGLEGTYRQLLLFVQTTLYGGKTRSNFVYNGKEWPAEMSIGPITGELGLGYIARETHHYRLTPFVGYRYFGIGPRPSKDDRYKDYLLESHAPMAGLMVDFTLATNRQSPNRTEDRTLFLRSRIVYSPLLNPTPFSGGLISFQIGLSGFGRPRKVLYVPRPTPVPTHKKFI